MVPLRDADPRVKVLSALVLVVGIVLGSPLSAVEFVALSLFLVASARVAGAPLRPLLARSLVALPVVGGLALFTALREASGLGLAELAQAWRIGWPSAASLLATSWLCVLTTLLLAAITPASELLPALSRLGVPGPLVTLLAFTFRFSGTLRAQVVAMRRALASRAPGLSSRAEVLLYGNLAGALVLRAHDRGQRVHAAMLSRGFDGELPSPPCRPLGPGDLAVAGVAVATVLALALARP